MFEIEEIKKIKDRKDKTAYQYYLQGENWTLLKFKKGCILGEHYHKGISKLRNPEVNILLEGKAEYYFKNIENGGTEKIVIDAPKIIKIKPFIYHEVKALTNSLLIEPFDEESSRDRFEL